MAKASHIGMLLMTSMKNNWVLGVLLLISLFPMGVKSEDVCKRVSNYFRCESKDLRSIPQDTVWTHVRYIRLQNNEIEEITENDFTAGTTTGVWELSLQNNRISIIHPKAFSRLTYLRSLYLHGNKLKYSSFQPKLFYGLIRLTQVQLHSNEFDVLPWYMFSPSDYRTSDGHPPSLKLSVGRNPMKCDLTACWMKHGSEDGWLSWIAVDGEESVPECVNSLTWPYIGVNCAQFGMYSSLL